MDIKSVFRTTDIICADVDNNLCDGRFIHMEDFSGFVGYNTDHLGNLYPKWIINQPEEISAFDLQGVQSPVPLNFRVTNCDM